MVGVVGNATCLINNSTRRRELADKLKLKELWRQAWEVDAVRVCFKNNLAAFQRKWYLDVEWTPNWICPAEMFLWLDKPITLNASEITGKKRLINMYGRYSRIDAKKAFEVLKCIPEEYRSATWRRLTTAIGSPNSDAEAEDIDDLRSRKDIRKTDREALIQARLGQGRFRSDLEHRWNSKCAVTGWGLRQILRASHIKPWRSSNDKERLDCCNGLLLAAHIDALFDRGLISFAATGEILLSSQIPESELQQLRLPMSLRGKLNAAELGYLAHHRRTWGFETE